MLYIDILLGILLAIVVIHSEIKLYKATKDAIEKIVKDVLKDIRRK